jgi:Secretion system C-terminal sorting domain/GEVED domain
MGLLHVFEGTEYDSGECPPNSDCITDNDMVCDTAPVKGMLTANPYPSNTDVNPCSGVFYNNEQHNMMNYGIPTNFTTGQSERAIASVLQLRQSLLHSKGGLAPDGLEAAAQPLAACIPSGTTSTATYNIGPVRVTFGDIDNTSTGRNNSTDGYFDYNTLTCKAFGLTTVIPKNTATPLTVEIDINGQNIAAYIDYNNDGVFSSTTEMVLSAPNTASYGTATVQVTPPANVVLDTPLRMRVISDLTGHGILPCALSYYGQTEDYMVTVSNSLSVQSPEKQTGLTLYPNPAGNALSINSASTINTVEVLDSNGRSVLTGNYAANEAQLNLTGLSAGVYLVKVSSDQGVITKKIVKL